MSRTSHRSAPGPSATPLAPRSPRLPPATRLRPPLPRSFYERGAEAMAETLLGCFLVRRHRGDILAGRIVETEAYVGVDDRACHAHSGRTARNAVMWGPPGHAYVYMIYGMYDLLNVVCQPDGIPEAVLLRALEPVRGLDAMRRRRDVRRDLDLANGPGKLCRAVAVTRAQDGVDLCGRELWLAPGTLRPGESVVHSTRIGVAYAGPDALRPLRFHLDGNPWVSR